MNIKSAWYSATEALRRALPIPRSDMASARSVNPTGGRPSDDVICGYDATWVFLSGRLTLFNQ
jgi:hypothetical protein